MNAARRTLAGSAAAALTAGTLAIAPAAQAAAMHVTPKFWHVYTSADDGAHRVANGGTYEGCDPVTQIYVRVRVTHAHADRPFKVIWTRDSTEVDRYTASYATGGTHRDWFAHPRSTPKVQSQRGLGLLGGLYKVVFKQGGAKVGGGRLTIAYVC